MTRSASWLVAWLACAACAACASSGTGSAGEGPSATPGTTATSSTRGDSAGLVPAGFGTLRQEDVALHLERLGLQLRAIPLDESVIRTLSPDSYRALRDLQRSKRAEIATIERRQGSRPVALWYIAFFGVEQGETPFSPMELIVTNVGRDFRPLDVIGLSPGFGEQRLRQRETQSALYAFDGRLDIDQPLTVQYETAVNAEWATILQRIERERSLIRTRAARP